MSDLPNGNKPMTADQYEALMRQVNENGTENERRMLVQMNWLVQSFMIMADERDQANQCRKQAEDSRDTLAHRNRMAQIALSGGLSKRNKDVLIGMIELARQELEGAPEMEADNDGQR